MNGRPRSTRRTSPRRHRPTFRRPPAARPPGRSASISRRSRPCKTARHRKRRYRATTAQNRTRKHSTKRKISTMSTIRTNLPPRPVPTFRKRMRRARRFKPHRSCPNLSPSPSHSRKARRKCRRERNTNLTCRWMTRRRSTRGSDHDPRAMEGLPEGVLPFQPVITEALLQRGGLNMMAPDQMTDAEYIDRILDPVLRPLIDDLSKRMPQNPMAYIRRWLQRPPPLNATIYDRRRYYDRTLAPIIHSLLEEALKRRPADILRWLRDLMNQAGLRNDGFDPATGEAPLPYRDYVASDETMLRLLKAAINNANPPRIGGSGLRQQVEAILKEKNADKKLPPGVAERLKMHNQFLDAATGGKGKSAGGAGTGGAGGGDREAVAEELLRLGNQLLGREGSAQYGASMQGGYSLGEPLIAKAEAMDAASKIHRGASFTPLSNKPPGEKSNWLPDPGPEGPHAPYGTGTPPLRGVVTTPGRFRSGGPPAPGTDGEVPKYDIFQLREPYDIDGQADRRRRDLMRQADDIYEDHFHHQFGHRDINFSQNMAVGESRLQNATTNPYTFYQEPKSGLAAGGNKVKLAVAAGGPPAAHQQLQAAMPDKTGAGGGSPSRSSSPGGPGSGKMKAKIAVDHVNQQSVRKKSTNVRANPNVKMAKNDKHSGTTSVNKQQQEGITKTKNTTKSSSPSSKGTAAAAAAPPRVSSSDDSEFVFEAFKSSLAAARRTHSSSGGGLINKPMSAAAAMAPFRGLSSSNGSTSSSSTTAGPPRGGATTSSHGPVVPPVPVSEIDPRQIAAKRDRIGPLSNRLELSQRLQQKLGEFTAEMEHLVSSKSKLEQEEKMNKTASSAGSLAKGAAAAAAEADRFAAIMAASKKATEKRITEERRQRHISAASASTISSATAAQHIRGENHNTRTATNVGEQTVPASASMLSAIHIYESNDEENYTNTTREAQASRIRAPSPSSTSTNKLTFYPDPRTATTSSGATSAADRRKKIVERAKNPGAEQERSGGAAVASRANFVARPSIPDKGKGAYLVRAGGQHSSRVASGFYEVWLPGTAEILKESTSALELVCFIKPKRMPPKFKFPDASRGEDSMRKAMLVQPLTANATQAVAMFLRRIQRNFGLEAVSLLADNDVAGENSSMTTTHLAEVLSVAASSPDHGGMMRPSSSLAGASGASSRTSTVGRLSREVENLVENSVPYLVILPGHVTIPADFKHVLRSRREWTDFACGCGGDFLSLESSSGP
ncbi:unnamed protein product [Amoebophrya sp. A120]|nr:unnamed protein product [Amoebophrya sp. A120]|eukprot:GSA120T00016942001.1